MVEVFRTSVKNPHYAQMLIELIESTFKEYKANFDLQDCDRILRIQTTEENIQVQRVLALLHSLGFAAEVLPDRLSEQVVMKQASD